MMSRRFFFRMLGVGVPVAAAGVVSARTIAEADAAVKAAHPVYVCDGTNTFLLGGTGIDVGGYSIIDPGHCHYIPPYQVRV